MPDHTLAETYAVIDAYLEAQAEARSAAPRKRPKRGRRQTASTRAKLSQRQFAHHRARALRANEVSPLRALRLDRGLTLKDAAAIALISPRTWGRAERNPEAVGPITFSRIAASLNVRPSALLPAD